MESYPNHNFSDVKAKNSSDEALQRWRNLSDVVKSPKRRFRFTANLSKRSEAEALKRTNQEKLRSAVMVSKAALQFLNFTSKEIDHGMKNFVNFNDVELKEATNNFNDDHKIGKGGFATVYKGVIHSTTVAIKVLNNENKQREKEFNNEIATLRNVGHPNLVTLIGACREKWALVYEYMPKGNLEDCLSNVEDRKSLSWRKRIQMASNICSALVFLHHSKPYGIIHGDLKPANILLDSTYTCKLSDFGTCRRLKLTDTTRTPHHKTQEPSFTMFYCDPEYLESNMITTHSDVFAFGVVLLQLVTGRDAMGIRKLVQDALSIGKLNEVVDVSANWPLKVAEKLAQLGLRCIERSRTDRPDLAKEVLPEIESMEQVADGGDVQEKFVILFLVIVSWFFFTYLY